MGDAYHVSAHIFCMVVNIAKPTNDPTSRRFFGANLTPVEDVVSDLYLPPSEAEWLFTVSQYIPGPGPTDFVCAFSSLDKAITGVGTICHPQPQPLFLYSSNKKVGSA